jgi:hypothetical protein
VERGGRFQHIYVTIALSLSLSVSLHGINHTCLSVARGLLDESLMQRPRGRSDPITTPSPTRSIECIIKTELHEGKLRDWGGGHTGSQQGLVLGSYATELH